MSMRLMAVQERSELADFLATLTPEQWDGPTLCTEWRVRDIVAHTIGYDALGVRGTLALARRGGVGTDRLNALVVAEFADRDPDDLVALVRRHRDPRGLTAAFGGMIALVDGMIHQQDIRRAMGVPRRIPGPRLRRALTCARLAPPIRVSARTRGLRLLATDVDWAAGRGAEVRGPGEALLMAGAGRPDAIGELTGPGRAVLASRLGA